MAYNVLKGNVEGSVDQHADQEIDGIKVFKNTISASVFYDTDAQSPCATENKVALTNIVNDTKNGILTYQGNKVAKSHYNLTFDGKTLSTENASFKKISGNAEGLYNIPATKLSGKLSANIIDCGDGVESRENKLRIKKGPGIKVLDTGVSVDIAPNGGLSLKNGKLTADPGNTQNVCVGGQNISDTDLIALYDVSRGDLRHTTLSNFYDAFVNIKVPHANGPVGAIQFKGNKSFEGSDVLVYDKASKSLTSNGKIKSNEFESCDHLASNGTTEINGALYKQIKTVSSENYMVQDNDNTILLDVTDNSVSLQLPLASENAGRVLNIKVIISDNQKYRIRGTHSAKITTLGELIDFTKEIHLKSNYSSRTIHSDGNKWWVISSTGS